MRSDDQPGTVRVAAGQDADHVVVGAAPKRKRRELHVQTEGGELVRDVIPGRAVALGCRDGVAHALEGKHMATQPLGENRPLTAG